MGLEILEDLPGVDVVVARIRWRGLVVRDHAAMKERAEGEGVRLEPETAAPLAWSLEVGSAQNFPTGSQLVRRCWASRRSRMWALASSPGWSIVSPLEEVRQTMSSWPSGTM